MNILDHRNFTNSLTSLPILKPFILEQQNQFHSFILIDSNNHYWDTICNETLVKFNKYNLRDIKFDLKKSKSDNSNHLNSTKGEGEFLEILFNIDDDIEQHSLHFIGIEDVNNDFVQYICVLDDNQVVPSLQFTSYNYLVNNENLEFIENCYRMMLSSYLIPENIPTIKEELSLTMLDDIRDKVSQIVMYGECNTLTSISYEDLGLTDEVIEDMKEKIDIEMQKSKEYQALSQKEKDRLFQENLNYEIQLFLHAAGDTDIFEEILNESQ